MPSKCTNSMAKNDSAFRPLEEFLKEKDVTERIAQTRHLHYEERRKERVKQVFDLINESGKEKSDLSLMKEHFPFFL